MTTTITASSADLKWWKSAVVYQIYPASFNDANGDGFGDLQGILNKLDYLQSLGIDAVWISPFYATPNYDMGYDISDYQRPDDKYGKLEEVDAIIKGCHERGLKILFDLVINHTSHQHRWFQEAQKSKDNPYRKYYMWAPPRFDENGKRMPPTNWRGVWSPSVWEWSEQTGEYYLHYFAPEQPDLNWELEEVRDAVFQEAIIYWLDRGVDGFRIDTSDMYSKRLPFEDVEVVDPHNYGQPYTYGDGPRLQEFLTEMAEKTFNKYDAVTIAEKGGESTVENMLTVVGAKEKKFSMAIRFDLVRADHDDKHYLYEKKMPLTVMKKVNEACQELAEPRHDAWLCNYLENHDQARSVSRFADESPAHRAMSARMLAIHLTTLSGTLLLYQGQEIGMINMPKDWPVDEYKDTMSIEYWRDIQKAVKDGVDGYNMDGALRGLQKLARDHARTPMQWSGEAMGGFTTGSETWMRVMDSYKDINVADQEKDSNSPLNFWRKMIALRKEHQSTFIFGKFDLIDEANEKTFCYTKTSYTSDDVLFVALNFTGDAQAVELPESLKGKGEPILLASAAPARTGFVGELQPWEGVVYLFK